eukprot:2956591-Karenia_brevis.AAC.1
MEKEVSMWEQQQQQQQQQGSSSSGLPTPWGRPASDQLQPTPPPPTPLARATDVSTTVKLTEHGCG